MSRRRPPVSPYVSRSDAGLLDPLPAELVRLVHAWRFLEDRIDPSRAIAYGTRSRSSSQWARGDDPERAWLRTLKDDTRKAIGRIADPLMKQLLEIKICPTCHDKNSRQDLYCGESKPEGKGCGYKWKLPPARTEVADA